MNKDICCVCKKETPDMHPRFGGLNKNPVCMGCEGIEIDVYKVSLPGQKTCYIDSDLRNIMDMLSECDYGEGYTIIKEKMAGGVYHNLPEFTGF